MNPPTGTVTFLFTDIEGSTRLWDEHAEEMRAALARHDAILGEAVAQQSGSVFKSMGDAVYAAFQRPIDALRAAVSGQSRLRAETWPNGIEPRVRMAIHTGAVDFRDNDYFGPPLNRISRLLSVGHGGQVLLSASSHELVRDTLPPDCTLKALGDHRLKDLGRPENVFQLCHPDLRADFPPLRSLESPELPNNLPLQLTSFVGREKEIEEVNRLLKNTRLLTLTGAGGCGKTRLAMHAAAEMLDGSGNGVWLAELAPVADPALVPQTVAGVFGLKEEPGRSLTQTLTEYLQSKYLLLVLDNCEHVLEASARLVDALLRGCPRLLILTTSREALGIAGETTYRVPSLCAPNPREPQTPESLSLYESARLFVERAEQASPGFRVTNRNAQSLASVCHRLDGIPLAIELAAARVRSLTVEDINARLDQRFRLLTGGSRTAIPRHQTLRSLIDWSYDLLSETEKELLRRLSVFVGGWTLASAEAVCAGEPVDEWETLDLLTSLADKSLVTAETTGESVRYRMLETVRQYARDLLLESGEGEMWRDRHRNHFLALAEEACPELLGSVQGRWLARLEAEHDNLRAALEWSAEDPEGGEAGLRLCAALWRFWRIRGHLREGRERCAAALAHTAAQELTTARAGALLAAGSLNTFLGEFPSAGAPLEQALALSCALSDRAGESAALAMLGVLSMQQGDFASARPVCEQALAIDRVLGHRAKEAGTLHNLGVATWRLGDYPAARMHFERALTINRELGNRDWEAKNLGCLAGLAADQGDYSAARVLYKQGLEIGRELGDRESEFIGTSNLGDLAYHEGDYAAAALLYEDALAICREQGNLYGEAILLSSLGFVSHKQGENSAARTFFAQALEIARETANRLTTAQSLEGMARLSTMTAPIRAARLWGAEEALREANGFALPPNEIPQHEKYVAAARAALGDDSAFDAAWQEGRELPLEQAIELALQDGA